METVQSVRIDHGSVSGSAMAYSQRQPSNHRGSSSELYKPSRSPLASGGAPTRYLQHPGAGGGGGGGPPPPPSAQPRYLPAQPPPQQYAYREYRPPRISLLPPEYSVRPRGDAPAPTSLSTPAASPSHHLPPGVVHPQQQPPGAMHSGASLQQPQQHAQPETVVLGNQPFKKIRLQEPLRIDTRDQPGSYNPQVEAISPTLPDHHIQEDQAFKTTKDELLQQIGKVDREIAKAESQISILKKKQAELEEIASKPAIKQDVEEVAQPKHQSLAQKIYAENRKKAQMAHSLLDTLGPKVDWPIYNQPSDTTVYHENKRRHQTFKRRLLEYFKKRHTDKESRESYLTQTYSKLMQEWLRKVDKIECSQKRKAKESKNREFFEKVFPELRKQREDKERFNRVGARIKSEADLEEIMDGLQEQEMEDKKMRSYAVIPPILLDARQRKLKYANNNGHILDMETEYKERQLLNVWTPSENEVFKEKYLQHPKNFGVIASYLDRKSVQDCVQHYYLTKKTENYKQLLRKSRQRTRASRNNPQKVNNAANNAVVDILTTGVTTRLQREQQQKTVQSVQQQAAAAAAAESSVVSTATTTIITTSANSCSTTSPTSTSGATITTTAANGTTVLASTMSNKISQVDDTTQVKVVNSNNVIVNTTACSVVVSSPSLQIVTTEAGLTTSCEIRDQNHDNSANSDQSNSGSATENKKKKERRKDKDNASMETSDDEVTEVQDKTSPGICTVCKSSLGPHLQSRPIPPPQASQYGLREEDIPPGGRVCNICRCKCVRSRYTHCPIPTCPNARGRVKRLRTLPVRWQELPVDLRDPIVSEFQIPAGVTKCCSACFNRIQRRLGAQEDWAEMEVNRLKMLLSEIGPVWTAVGERLGRSGHQVKAFYSVNRKRLGLEACLGDSKPVLTDEEESGSSTSSCEEQPMTRDRHSSDTASAESPPAAPEQPQGPARKEDYDSSATETADEGQTPDHFPGGSATITVVNSDGQPRAGNSSPMTVKDLMSNVIELQLMKNSAATAQPHTPASGMTPTISSILNIDSPDVTIIREYNLNNQPQSNNQNDMNLARLVTPLIAATITPVPAQGPPEQPPQREELVVLQVQDGRDPEPMTLDLSLKKPREPIPPPAHAKHPMSIHRTEPYIQYHHGRKSPAVYVSAVARTQPKLPSPKPANPKAGSITLGTPIINQQQRYEGLLRQMTPDTKMGSITQGTPIHVPAHMQDKRIYEYYKRQPQQQGSTYPGQYRPPAYAVEQQLSSRQIIMNDYITSQQMHGPRRVEKPSPQQNYYPTSSPHRTPPPQPQRQGVIQRHTRPQPHYPPGHEALSSLVDVAVQQPSLPVPAAPHEGLGKTIVDHLSEPHRFHLAQMQQQMRHQQRFAEERRVQMAYREHQAQQQANKQHQQQQQPSRVGDSSTMTAASLIDAIITHQINQPTETGGREVVSNSREPPRPSDRLFQSFHREPPQNQNQPENNGDRPPSVISVDLEAEPQNKSMTVKEITDSVINMDFRQPGTYYHQDNVAEQWKRRLQKEEKPRSGTPQTDERQIIRIAQPQQKYQPVSPPENNHWSDGHGHDYRRFAPTQSHPQSHISALDYVKHRIVEVMRTEDDKRDEKDVPHGEKDRSDSPGDMVIDEDKHEVEFQQQPSNFAYAYSALNVPHGVPQGGPTKAEPQPANDNSRSVEPKPLLSAQYEPLSDED